MSERELRYERWLIWLVSQLNERQIATRLVYDDHLAGDQLAVPCWPAIGFAELHVWRRGPRQVSLHLLAVSVDVVGALCSALADLHRAVPIHARAKRRFVTAIEQLATGLAQTFSARTGGYPGPTRALLEQVFAPPNLPAGLIGVASSLHDQANDELSINLPGHRAPTLFGAAVTIETGARALLWDPSLGGFRVPREVQAHLQRRFGLIDPDKARAWGLVGLSELPPSRLGEDVEIRKRKRNGNSDPGGDPACDLNDCMFVDCDLPMSNCDLPDCDPGGCACGD